MMSVLRTRDWLLDAALATWSESGIQHLTQTEVARRAAAAIVDHAHMRMFIAMMVEADGDAAVRTVMSRGTKQMEAAVAEALGDRRNLARARLVLAAVWGLGLYQFLMRPRPDVDRGTSHAIDRDIV